MQRAFDAFRSAIGPRKGTETTLQPAAYAGSNAHVRRMMAALEPLEPDLVAVLLHGSLADCSTTPYSDFDVLAVLSNRAIETPGRLAPLASRLGELQRILFDFDPLQHHGWQVLSEADLCAYTESPLPLETLRTAVSLLPEPGKVEIRVEVDEASACGELERVADSVIAGAEVRRQPTNLFDLKALLSRFMLLPALFLRAVEGRAVSKSASFEAARGHFDPATWLPMETASGLRLDWRQEMPPLTRLLLARPGPLRARLARRLAPRIPSPWGSSLDAEFYDGLAALARAMVHRSRSVSTQNPHPA